MAYQTLDEFNVTAGGYRILLYVADTVPIFFPMVLFTIFMVIMMGTYFARKRMVGTSSFITSMAVAGYITTIISFIMMLIPNLVNGLTVAVCLVVSIISTILLLTQNRWCC